MRPDIYSEMASEIQVFVTELFKKTLKKYIKDSESKYNSVKLNTNNSITFLNAPPISPERPSFSPSQSASVSFETISNGIQTEFRKVLADITASCFAQGAVSFCGYKIRPVEDDD